VFYKPEKMPDIAGILQEIESIEKDLNQLEKGFGL